VLPQSVSSRPVPCRLKTVLSELSLYALASESLNTSSRVSGLLSWPAVFSESHSDQDFIAL
jgi:hypothetical protein